MLIICDANRHSYTLANVANILMRELGVPDHNWRRAPASRYSMAFLPRYEGRHNTKPRSNSDPDKLTSLGFESRVRSEIGLAGHITSYRSPHVNWR